MRIPARFQSVSRKRVAAFWRLTTWEMAQEGYAERRPRNAFSANWFSLKNKLTRGINLIEMLVASSIVATLAILIFPVVATVKQSSQAGACANNLRVLSVAIHQYVSDHDGFMPPAGRREENYGSWIQTTPPGRIYPYNTSYLAPYLGSEQGPGTTGSKAFICPGDSLSKGTDGTPDAWNSYGYNATYLGGFFSDYNAPSAKLNAVLAPAKTVLFVEQSSGLGWGPYPPSVSGRWQAWETVKQWRHKNSMNVAFVDGHVERLPSDDEDLNATDDRLWDLE